MPDDRVLAPGATIGILGGGQLGRMLALAAARLGFKCHIYAPPGDNPAFDVASAITPAAYDDEKALSEFAGTVDVATYEFENIPLPAAAVVERKARLYPPATALEISQHRASEKSFFGDLGIKTADWICDQDVDAVATQTASRFAAGDWGIIKTCRMGYDGKGQVRVENEQELRNAWAGFTGQELIFEWQVPFTREISVIAARAPDGAVKAFDIAENSHEDGILRTSLVPARINQSTVGLAHQIASAALQELNYIGVIAIELFVVKDGGKEQLVVNEFAPRVHNSGHWTEAACSVSQFEQHIRAIAGWPLGDPKRHADAEMTNLLGDDINAWTSLAAESDAVVHVYGKSGARPGRKMGHVTRLRPLSSR